MALKLDTPRSPQKNWQCRCKKNPGHGRDWWVIQSVGKVSRDPGSDRTAIWIRQALRTYRPPQRHSDDGRIFGSIPGDLEWWGSPLPGLFYFGYLSSELSDRLFKLDNFT